MMDDEDYEFDYEDSDQDQDDGQVDMENEYYTAKGDRILFEAGFDCELRHTLRLHNHY